MDFLTKALGKFIGNFASGLLVNVTTLTKDIYETYVIDYIDRSTVHSLQLMFVGIAVTMIVLICSKRYFDVYVMESAGDPDADPMDIIVNGTKAIAITTNASWIFGTIINFSSSIASLSIQTLGENTDWSADINDVLLSLIANIASQGFLWLILLLILIIGICVFFIVAMLRAAELMLMYILMPIFCIDLCFNSPDRFKNFMTNLCVTSFYYILQLICFYMFSQSFISMLTGVRPDSEIGTAGFGVLAWMIATLKSPKWLEKFAYSTGLGGAVKHGASTIGTSLARSVFQFK